MDKPCFELKGSLFTLTVLQLFENDLSLLESELQERVKMAPGFFNRTPLVIDLHNLPEAQQDIDFSALRELLLSLSIIPVGVKGAAKAVHTALAAAGMAILAEAKHSRGKTAHLKKPPQAESQSQQLAESAPTTTGAEQQATTASQNQPIEADTLTQSESPKATSAHPVKIVKQTIRSGRQIYEADGDLVIIGSVSAGAEILAAGNIHIYGTLRGRALAGVHGDQSASIFCNSLQSELISIAGIYLLSDDIPADKIGASVQVFLEHEKLQIETIF